jgi:lipopolysaccharide transport system permease protein
MSHSKDLRDIDASRFDKVITSSNTLVSAGLRDLLHYRDLLFLFVRRDFVAQYKQTILGPIWFFIQPILTTFTFVIIFGKVANIPTNGLPPILFYISGITLWNYFADCLVKTSDTFITNQHIFGKVYFPRLVIPLSIVVSNLIKLGVQFILFFAFYLFYIIKGENIIPNAYALLLPILIIIMAGLGLGFGIIISAMTTKYRDLRFLIQFGVQLAMYTTPIVYPLELAGKYKYLILANPMTSIIEAFKFSFLGKGDFNWYYLLYSFVFMLVLLVIGLKVFNNVERKFVDTI